MKENQNDFFSKKKENEQKNLKNPTSNQNNHFRGKSENSNTYIDITNTNSNYSSTGNKQQRSNNHKAIS